MKYTARELFVTDEEIERARFILKLFNGKIVEIKEGWYEC